MRSNLGLTVQKEIEDWLYKKCTWLHGIKWKGQASRESGNSESRRDVRGFDLMVKRRRNRETLGHDEHVLDTIRGTNVHLLDSLRTTQSMVVFEREKKKAKGWHLNVIIFAQVSSLQGQAENEENRGLTISDFLGFCSFLKMPNSSIISPKTRLHNFPSSVIPSVSWSLRSHWFHWIHALLHLLRTLFWTCPLSSKPRVDDCFDSSLQQLTNFDQSSSSTNGHQQTMASTSTCSQWIAAWLTISSRQPYQKNVLKWDKTTKDWWP